MRPIIIGFLSILTINSNVAQRGVDPCSRKLYDFTDNPSKEQMDLFSWDQDDFVIKYTKAYHPDCLPYLSLTKDELLPINNTIIFDDYVEFSSSTEGGDSIKIEIEFQEEMLNLQSDSVVLFILSEDVICLDSINGRRPYGRTEYIVDSNQIIKINRIKTIWFTINGAKYSTGKALFDDLLNPNVFYQYRSFRPIEVYYSRNARAYYIYIYGDLPNKSRDVDDMAFRAGYLSKIILKEDGTCTRIMMSGDYLRYYGWMQCDSFWMF